MFGLKSFLKKEKPARRVHASQVQPVTVNVEECEEERQEKMEEEQEKEEDKEKEEAKDEAKEENIAKASEKTDSGWASWQEFIQDTTVHGVKYVFPDNLKPSAVRRFIWACLVLTSAGLFTWQVVNRTSEYLHYYSTINIEVDHADTLDFPAVTICNQNSYRLTQADKLGLYRYISDLYSGQGANVSPPVKSEEYNSSGVILSLAHQFEDLITRCTWRGKPCNSSNFKLRFTSYGVCYTFNGDDEPLMTSQAGSGSSLSLTMNTEQYEKMPGPHHGEGLKVLLHDQSEEPLVKDLGFAVGPGTHTLVGVKRVEISSLPDPHGNCLHDIEAMSTCKFTCQSREIGSRCGCGVGMMPGLEADVAPCNINSTFTCVLPYWDSLTEKDLDCDCQLPCQRVTYEPILSYAHVSWSGAVQTQETEKGIDEKFKHAREVERRVKKHIAIRDKQKIEDVVNIIAKRSQVGKSLIFLIEEQPLSNGTKRSAVEVYSRLTIEFQKVIKEFEVKLQQIKTFPPLTSVYWISKEFPKLLDLNVNLSGFATMLYNCSTSLPQAEPDACGFVCEWNKKKYIGCREHELRRFERELGVTEDDLEGLYKAYMFLVEFLFDGTNMAYNESEVHLNCSNMISTSVSIWKPDFEKAFCAIKSYKNASVNDWLSKISAVAELLLVYPQMMKNLIKVTDIAGSCSWFTPTKSNLDIYHTFYMHFQSAAKSSGSALEILGFLKDCLWKSYDRIGRVSEWLEEHLQSYLVGNITKQQMQVALHEIKISKSHWDLLNCGNSLKNLNLLLDRMNKLFLENLNETNYLFPPVRPDFKKSIAEYLGLGSSDETALRNQLNTFFEAYFQNAKDGYTETFGIYTELDRTIDSLVNEFDSFVEGLATDEEFYNENFIKMDIFYNSLSYDKISQHKALEVFSLLSEVGGFMGLLLGASVLTLFEFLDYLTHRIINKWRSK